jgi:phosphate transport system permease protein
MNAIASAPRQIRLSRRIVSITGWALSGMCLAVLAVLMVWILSVVFVRGVGALNLTVLTTVTQGSGGGLLNAIEGTLVLSAGALLLAVPFGVAAGIYSAEYRFSSWAVIIRFLADVLVGVPSIVIGYFGYVALVQWLGWNFSLAAGAISLAIISLPYICRTTELALRQVSNDLRDAAFSLGANERRVIFGVCLPAALPAILTGVLLALAVSVGETAPLLYTAGWSNFMWDGHLTHSPIGYLTYAIWTFINEPFASANALAYAAALLVTGFVLIINILARFVLERRRIRR